MSEQGSRFGVPVCPQGPNRKRKALGLQRRLNKAVADCFDYLESEGLPGQRGLYLDTVTAARDLGRHVVKETQRKYRGPTGSPTYAEVPK